jgi:hypothetical protein
MTDLASGDRAIDDVERIPHRNDVELRTAVLSDEAGITVLVEGELDLATGPGLYQELDRLLTFKPTALKVNLSSRSLTAPESRS